MSVITQHQDQVLLFTFEGAITESDIKSAVNQTTAACDQSPVPVNIIADATGMTRFPPNILMLLKTQVAPCYHSNMGTVVVVTRSIVITKIVMFLCRVMPVATIQIAHSLAEAKKQVNTLTRVAN